MVVHTLQQILQVSVSPLRNSERDRLVDFFSRSPQGSIAFRSRDSLVRHMQALCPREFTCKRCSVSFTSVELLARHEADSHLEIRLDDTESLNDCDQCDRRFLDWNMLKQHRRQCDHLAELTELLRDDTRCSLCNRCV